MHVHTHATHQALALEAAQDREMSEGGGGGADDQPSIEARMFYEITVASVDQPKLLSRLSEALVGGPVRVLVGLPWWVGCCGCCWAVCYPCHDSVALLPSPVLTPAPAPAPHSCA